ncbi:hypothetical protein BDP27DRAFT_1334504 [Rhodocollybia butyracea]|uniref:Xylanolytic transcriptional activator regulatory domain-containing protein n=1 Tax=Rhodocollybia butyracea TaxID=206335 RepID=A0A9P5PI67_9AGAR|nr:hypothetical protein BDP27DRAFT_1334504 [Rhodocollybia butyracea]
MSDNDNDLSRSDSRSTALPTAVKQRRLQHACDACKKRKSDSSTKRGGPCSHCISLKVECRHTLPRKKRGPVAGQSKLLNSTNIQALTTSILSSVPYVIPKDETELRKILKELASYIRTLEDELARSESKESHQDEDGPPSSSEEEEEDAELTERLEQFRVAYSRGRYNGYPRISLIKAIKTGLNDNKNDKAHFDAFKRLFTGKYNLPYFPSTGPARRSPGIWWEKVHYNYPLLHRPTFEKSIAAGLHTYDRHFGEAVLAVCALASRYSNDPRVFMHGSQLSAGFMWMQQVHPVPTSFLEAQPFQRFKNLLSQMYMMFMQTTTLPHSGWVLCGIGMRMLQDVVSGSPTVSTELWKRVFWYVNYIDISMSLNLGRPRAASSNDYDTELPFECDDEYWEQPGDLAFKQPAGERCKLSYWMHTLKLLNILDHFQHEMSFVRRSASWRKAEQDVLARRQRSIIEIDKALSNWLETIRKSVVKWDPQRSDAKLFSQSTLLYLMYYFLRIETHRTSISSPASLEVCISTAHSCVLVIEAHRQRDSPLLGPQPLATIANAATILVIRMWKSQRLRLNLDLVTEMGYVVKCMDFLASIEHRVQLAGRLWDTILNVIFISDLTDAYNVARERSLIERSSQQSLFEMQAGSFSAPSEFELPSSLESYHHGGDFQSGPFHQDEFSSLIPSNYPSQETSVPFYPLGGEIAFDSSQNVGGNVGQQPWISTTKETSDAMDVSEADWNQYMQSVDEILKALRQN